MKLERWFWLWHGRRKRGSLVLATACFLALASTARADFKDDDFNIGVDPDASKLSILWNGEARELPFIEDGFLSGFGIDDPGFITLDESFGGLLPPDSGANIVLEVVSFDTALKAWKPGFGESFQSPGDLWDIGPVPAHQHPFWHIDSTDAGFDPGQTEWNATFRILDTGSTGYEPSDPVTVTFTTPEPSTAALLLLAVAWGAQRSRRRRQKGVYLS